MYKIIYLLIILSVSGILYAQNEEKPVPSTNLEIINSLLDSSVSKFEDYFTVLGKDNYYNVKTDIKNEISDYIFNYLRRKLTSVKFISTLEDRERNSIKFDLSSLKIRTEYSNVGNFQVLKKNMNRKIEVGFNSGFKRDDTLLYSFSFLKTYSDEFDFSYLNYVESGNLNFVKGEIPEQGFWDRYLIPVAAIAVSAAAIILFFAIRSK